MGLVFWARDPDRRRRRRADCQRGVERLPLRAGSGRGPDEDDAITFFDGTASDTVVYFEGTLLPAGEIDAVSSGDALPVPDEAHVTTWPADQLGLEVVPRVGTHFPTAEESALLAEIAAAL